MKSLLKKFIANILSHTFFSQPKSHECK